MKIINLFYSLFQYGKYIPQIIFFEIYYFIKGYRHNSIYIFNNEKFTDNIPCPYFFLKKIKKFIIQKKIKSFIDLGCGYGRVINFLSDNDKIKFYGIELHSKIFEKCKINFKNHDNIEILNEDFRFIEFDKFNNDCFFINDPLKKIDDFNNLITNNLKNNDKNKKIVYFVLVNIDELKRKIFNKYKLIDSLNINTKGYYIYSNEKTY